MNTVPTVTILDEAAKCFMTARQRIAEGMEHLYKISNEKLWEVGGYSSFGDFCETGCGISPSMGSKLVKVYTHYVIDGGVSLRKLESIDAEKTYLAIGLGGSVDSQLAKAQTLSRQDLRAELSEDEQGNDCPHAETVTICKKCNARV